MKVLGAQSCLTLSDPVDWGWWCSWQSESDGDDGDDGHDGHDGDGDGDGAVAAPGGCGDSGNDDMVMLI